MRGDVRIADVGERAQDAQDPDAHGASLVALGAGFGQLVVERAQGRPRRRRRARDEPVERRLARQPAAVFEQGDRVALEGIGVARGGKHRQPRGIRVGAALLRHAPPYHASRRSRSLWRCRIAARGGGCTLLRHPPR
ncbi:MAG: hypothetical protein IVW36_05725 [Dehalococcoidia bacterium]|nr:hypothetical protein [Dehalococcoidia bacterium]